ncbi:MAG: S26 family signal peptidase [Betaproteobacteria bacterium]|nr:S26 family signal peptidase [Betaproteobacteria bacterium]
MLAVMALAIVALARPADHSDARLFNDSASVPLGFWRRVQTPIVKGAVIGFHPPAAAMPYVLAHMPEYASKKLIQKYVVAMAGDRICRAGTAFSVNGAVLGQAALTDYQGHPLPTWTGCRTLGAGQVAVFSNRIPNSFDSRYYGAIPASNIIGVYRPLWTW